MLGPLPVATVGRRQWVDCPWGSVPAFAGLAFATNRYPDWMELPAAAARASAEHVFALSICSQANPRRALLRSNVDEAPDGSPGEELAPVSLCGGGVGCPVPALPQGQGAALLAGGSHGLI